MSKMNRRNFMKATAVAGAGYWLTANAISATRAADKPNGKIHVAGIGVGGKGSSDIDQAGNIGEVVALCDIDEGNLDGKAQRFSSAEKFFDYRKMFDKMAKQIDAVTVSTPDHTHAPASITAMKLGKHVYCQKPLTHDVWEARQMRLLAKEYKVCTQMGNQGTAHDGLRRAVEIVRAGVLGDVTEVHVWTNRPIWPQGSEAILAVPAVRQAAMAALHHRDPGPLNYPQAPSRVHWDEFLGTAPSRPFTPGVHPFAWRGWWDYGTGALGDMACHTANMAFMALELGSPVSAEATKVVDLNPETCPTQAHVVLKFPARGSRKPVTWHWYEGQFRGRKMLPPDRLLAKVLQPREKLADSGSMLVGSKGILFSPNDYGADYRLIGEGVEEAAKGVPQTLPRNGKVDSDQAMKNEWAKAIHENNPSIAMSNFDYAGMLAETVLLGNVAIRTGKKLEFDGEKCEITNCKEAAQYMRREYRKGFQV